MSEKVKHVSLNRICGSSVFDVVTLPASLCHTIFHLPEATEKHAIPFLQMKLFTSLLNASYSDLILPKTVLLIANLYVTPKQYDFFSSSVGH